MISEEKIREISTRINGIRENYIDYLEIYQCTNMLLEAIYKDEKAKMFQNPKLCDIDIKNIARELGLGIVEQPVNRKQYKYFIIALLLKRKNRVTKETEATIIGSSEVKLQLLRVQIAKLIYFYIKYYNDVRVNKEIKLTIFEYEETEEIIADIFARLLLLPPMIVQKEFKTWKENYGDMNDTSKHIEKWYEYLARLVCVTRDDAVIGWQEDRIVLNLLEESKR